MTRLPSSKRQSKNQLSRKGTVADNDQTVLLTDSLKKDQNNYDERHADQ